MFTFYDPHFADKFNSDFLTVCILFVTYAIIEKGRFSNANCNFSLRIIKMFGICFRFDELIEII